MTKLMTAKQTRPAATLQQVAERTGFSRALVSKVLNNSAGNIGASEQSRESIQRVAAELGYRRNTAASATRTGRFGNITLLISRENRSLFLPPGLLRQLELQSARHNSHLMVAEAPDQEMTNPDRVPKVFRELGTDGLLIDYCGSIPPMMGELMERYNIPSVWINDRRPHDAVYPDDLAAGRAATAEMIQLGHRQIVYIDNENVTHYSARDRREGYMAAIEAAGLPPHVITLPRQPAAKLELFDKLLGQPDRPTAFICYPNDALHALGAVAFHRHLRIPRDLSITCFAMVSELEMAGARVACRFLPQDRMAECAIDMLFKKIAEPDRILPAQAIEMRHGQLSNSHAPPPPL